MEKKDIEWYTRGNRIVEVSSNLKVKYLLHFYANYSIPNVFTSKSMVKPTTDLYAYISPIRKVLA